MTLRDTGTPRVIRGFLHGGPEVKQAVWVVEHPDPWGHWDCCKRTNLRWFDSWPEAIQFALSRRWQ